MQKIDSLQHLKEQITIKEKISKSDIQKLLENMENMSNSLEC